MRALEGLKPERVFYYFEEICKIPHGSYNTKQISDYCYQKALSLGLWARQDSYNNVVIKKPATAGYENVSTVMIQGHMDMVCVKDENIQFDFEKDSLQLVVENGYVRATGTTLGGDDGIAVAMALAILEDTSIQHPALEVILTTEEEVGMEGAVGLETSDLTAKYLLNLDSEEEGIFLGGCAGGVKADAVLSFDTIKIEGTKINVRVHGLLGGHSGAEIHKCRANANILLGRLLFEIKENMPYYLMSISGGEKDNAIPVSSCAEIVIDQEDVEDLMLIISDFEHAIQNEYAVSDPNIKMSVQIDYSGEYDAMSLTMMEKVVFMLMQVPNGIQTMCAALPGLVESSLNLGIIRTTEKGVILTWAIRSMVKSLKILMRDKLQYLCDMFGWVITFHGDYPEWPFNPESKMCRLSSYLYEKMTGKSAVVQTIHAGLECGLLAEKMPELDMVSMGPDMKDIHTSRERLYIDSVERTYSLVLEILKSLNDDKER